MKYIQPRYDNALLAALLNNYTFSNPRRLSEYTCHSCETKQSGGSWEAHMPDDPTPYRVCPDCADFAVRGNDKPFREATK